MAEEKVYTQEIIDDSPFPNQTGEEITREGSSSSKDIYSSTVIPDKKLPKKLIAVEVISSALNTQSRRIIDAFEFIKQGAIQIGEYVSGASGDIRISQNGIVARDSAGNITITIDGTTGNVTMKGTMQSGSVITGQIVVGNNTWIIDGDPDNPRIVLYNSGVPEIVIGEV